MAGRARSPAPRAPAERQPVARVAVDVPLAHLDRPFDYLVPAGQAEAAVPGCRVRVRFAGKLTGGYLLARADASDHQGKLAYLERVVSPVPVLGPELAALAREVADRYAGTLADVLRLAIPPRHAGAEATAPPPPPVPPPAPDPGGWARYPAGPAFLRALARGAAPRVVWTALPGPDWPGEIARAAAAAASAGRGALVIVPDARDLALVDAALGEVLGPGQHTCLSAAMGPAERYRRWLAAAAGSARVVAGTRAAMFAPVRALGLVVLWDDGDDSHAEPRAPYPHAREVLALRAHRAGAGALIGGFTRTAEAASLAASGWAVPVTADRATIRAHAPRVQATGDDAELARDEAARTARIPSLALRAARDGLRQGAVLVQVPRRGYLRSVACDACRARVRCAECEGPLTVTARDQPPACGWCGRPAAAWRCPACGGARLRAAVSGANRTAEELARAFPGARVVIAGAGTAGTGTGGAGTGAAGGAVSRAAPGTARGAVGDLVIATPGAEPPVPGGYAAALLLDGWALLARPALDAEREALRRWMSAAALVRPGPDGGVVIAVTDAGLPATQALIRWDPDTYAERELAERAELGFPPASRIAALTGDPAAVAELASLVEVPAGASTLGPVDLPAPPAAGGGAGPRVRTLIRVPRAAGPALAAALRTAQAARSARKAEGTVRVQIDPVGEL